MLESLTIISGGQTGADRAGLDWAIARGIPHGGWCPRGRKALDGPLPAVYQLKESPSSGYAQRTEWNVRDSDGTVVFTLAPEATGGSLKTVRHAQKLGKPVLRLHPGVPDAPAQLAQFTAEHRISLLNVAGSRESKEPGLYVWVMAILDLAFKEI